MKITSVVSAVLVALLVTFVAGGCTQNMRLRTSETAVSGKRPHLDQRKVYLADPRDGRAVRDKVGQHIETRANDPEGEGPMSVPVLDYKSDVPLTTDVKEAFRQAFKAAGADVVSSKDEADLQIQVQIEKFFVTTNTTYTIGPDGMATSANSMATGDVELVVAVLDAKGFEVGKTPFAASFEEPGDEPDVLSVKLNDLVAEVVDSELVVKVASAAGDAVADGGEGADGAGVDGGAGTGGTAGRVFLRYEGDKKLAKVLASKGAYFQGPILERGGVEFAGSGEMEKVYEGLCSEMGVGADELRKCRLQAASRIYVQEILELSVRQPDKAHYEITLEVWKPETNGLVSAKAVRVPASSLDEAAEQALPQLACAYLTYRGDETPCAAQ